MDDATAEASAAEVSYLTNADIRRRLAGAEALLHRARTHVGEVWSLAADIDAFLGFPEER